MPRRTRVQAFALAALLVAPGAVAQLTGVPDLATATQATATTTTSASTGTSATTGTTGTSGTTGTTGTSGTSATSATTGATTSGSTSASTSASTTGTPTGTAPVFSLSGAPTIAGAGIPTLVIPYTADAPFMQKSTLPEGTVFIAVGAVLAFLGACVLLWRGLVAWSINRSVKRAAVASLRGPEKQNTWGTTSRTNVYKEYDPGSSMSLDALTSSGKPIKNFRDHDPTPRGSAVVPPAGLFFSPTANAQQRNSTVGYDAGPNRSSTYLPAGYYASAAATQPAGGVGATTIGGGLAPFARQSATNTPSPPVSPNLGPAQMPKEGLRSGPRERLPSSSRNQYAGQTSSFYRQSSASNLGIGLNNGARASTEHLGGSRAPSAILDDLFDNHGNVPRDRH